MPSLLNGLSPFRAYHLKASPSGHKSNGSGLAIRAKVWKIFEDICNNVNFCEFPHPAHVYELGFKMVESLDSTTIDQLSIVGSYIYTNGSRIEGKIGAVLTEWRDGVESGYSTYRIEPLYTIFQAEMFVLHREITRAKKSKCKDLSTP
ncbi:hypothetical protein EVAR_44314_1 [Eumeta japonica]|uniref:Uncharacterized protein n=1 Tax=Eumeta variegata TaxID=151549 RepID=A0A4C1XA25_EUMVA|nr:hypothetical protein EVAR_44314_1 [Eumeta japonica]